VTALEVAWTFRTGETPEAVPTGRPTAFEATPIVVDGILYLSTPLGRVFALDPSTGVQRWRYDAKVDPALEFGDFTSRGVSTWLDAEVAAAAPCRRGIILATIEARLIALDAEAGRPCAGFGEGGTVDLRRGLRNPPDFTKEYEVTSPPAVVKGLIVVGSGVADNGRTDAASGEVRAYDARTGELRWTWNPVPADSSDPGWPTWQGPAAHRTGAANAWSVIAADPERDLVFVPTGSASPDYYGGERRGANLYANSLVALRASTGERVWHFQVVHHDLWDYDVASPPALATLSKDGREIPVVLQTTKTGQLFVLNRETGEPVFPVVERPAPKSTVPGEEAWPTQPFSSLPAHESAALHGR
jgi:quinoprotein glucose dehydrogenase